MVTSGLVNLVAQTPLIGSALSGFMKGSQGAVEEHKKMIEAGGTPKMSLKEAATAGGVAGGVMGAIMILVDIMKSVVSFIANLAPIKALISMITKIMTLFMLPVAMFILGLFLPFVTLFFNILKSMNIPQLMQQFLKNGQIIGNAIASVFQILQPYMPMIGKILEYIMIFLAGTLIVPLLVIAATILLVKFYIDMVVKMVQVLNPYILKIVSILTNVYNFFVSVFSPVLSAISGVLSTIATVIQNLSPGNIASSIGGFFSHIPGFASGGHIYSTGLAYLHAGETVVPSGGSSTNNNTFNINMNSSGSSATDANKLADLVYKNIQNRLRGSVGW